MEMIDASMTYRTKHSTQANWKMDIMPIPALKSLLRTSRYLMDEVTGQFYAVFGNSYQCMCTIPRLFHTWEPGQLINELAATRCTFGCMGPTGPAPATQISQPHLVDPVSTAYTENLIPDLTTQKPPPRTVPYQPPSFNLDRPTKHLTKEERGTSQLYFCCF